MSKSRANPSKTVQETETVPHTNQDFCFVTMWRVDLALARLKPKNASYVLVVAKWNTYGEENLITHKNM
jgi:hypothetical protein